MGPNWDLLENSIFLLARRVRKVVGKKKQNSIARENSFGQLGCLKNHGNEKSIAKCVRRVLFRQEGSF